MAFQASGNVTSLGVTVLDVLYSYSIEKFDVDPKQFWYWIGVAALLVGFTILFNVLFIFSLMYLNPLGKPQAMISEEEANEQSNQGGTNNTREMESSQSNAAAGEDSYEVEDGIAVKKGTILLFTPLCMLFDGVNYFVDMPLVRI
ncbi:hypothetical protein LWI29_023583 [Acer saccharum]|uniref:Plant PDR ABC transporter associated domain-containing protein n=1 Tax=Acer saccharum TaxID=4024 RepID=A0AA39SV26_ACESA|nr:hypothetical protein LWI29_016054 [Acer saccharum]KAK0597093.1 hypothetical protein LWI29_021752 [Acer saccharum]KAK0597274.1 hypothetical protein LWI29_023583 [Acer saccharum]